MSAVTRTGRTSTRGRRATTVGCWLAVLPTATWSVLRLAGLERGPLVPAVAFTPYVAAGALLPLALALALRRTAAAVVAGLAALALVAAG